MLSRLDFFRRTLCSSLASWVNSITSVWTRPGSGSVTALQGPTSLTLGDLTSQALCFCSWGAYPWIYITLTEAERSEWVLKSNHIRHHGLLYCQRPRSGTSSVKPASSCCSFRACSSLDYHSVNKESVSLNQYQYQTTLLLCKWIIAHNCPCKAFLREKFVSWTESNQNSLTYIGTLYTCVNWLHTPLQKYKTDD